MIINLLDISNFIYRSFFAVKNIELGAVYGVCSDIISLIKRFPGAIFIAACDSGKTTFRNEVYKDYKANRSSMDKKLVEQLPIIKQALDAFGIQQIKRDGYEADDIIASLVRILRDQDAIVNIMSFDKDLIQLLVEGKVNVYNIGVNEAYTEAIVVQKFGVKPCQFLDYLALVGDAVDNIPGVPGIGTKSAAGLLNKFGTLDNIAQNLEQLPTHKRFDAIKTNIDQAYMSRKLAMLHDSLDIAVEYSNITPNEAIAFLSDLGFNQLSNRVRKCFHM